MRMYADWNTKEGKLIVDGDRYSYWNRGAMVYVRDGIGYRHSVAGPHFLDIGIMGYCRNACPECYMVDKTLNCHMSSKDLDLLIDRYRSTLCQVSFGGAGDPLDYSDFGCLPSWSSDVARDRWFAADLLGKSKYPGLAKGDAVSSEFHEDLRNIARCCTVNLRERRVTDKESETLNKFAAVGLSCGSAEHFGPLGYVEEFVRRVESLPYYKRTKLVLHVIMDPYATLTSRAMLRLLTYDSVVGVLFLAYKHNKRHRHVNLGGFAGREHQLRFWRNVATIRDLTNKWVAVDSCFAPWLDAKTLGDVYRPAMHPCDAGRFSAYVHADGKMRLCSCGGDPVDGWAQAVKTCRDCSGLSPVSERDLYELARRFVWRSPPVVIQHGPMTNSSSASYFVIAPPKAKFKLRVLDRVGRFKRREKDAWGYGSELRFGWTANNRRLVEVTKGEWASWCALAIASADDPLEVKRYFDRYTRRILKGEKVYYLVADRETDDNYQSGGVSDDRWVTVIAAGEEH